MLKYLLPLILLSCGQVEPKKPAVNSPELQEQIERITPQLLFCDGAPAFPRKNNITGQPMCDVGDSVSTLGRTLIDGNLGDFSAIERSITEDGLYRHPSYVGRDKVDEFSRDQFLGLMEATVATRNHGPLNRAMDFIAKYGKLCKNPTDGRCDVTPSVRVLAKDVLGHTVNVLERSADESTILSEAHTVSSGYPAYLVARKLMLHARTKTATQGYAMAAKVLAARFPDALFVETVSKIYNGGNFDSTAKKLSKCMAAWQKPGMNWWTGKACKDQQGAEMVSLAILLTQTPISLFQFFPEDNSFF